MASSFFVLFIFFCILYFFSSFCGFVSLIASQCQCSHLPVKSLFCFVEDDVDSSLLGLAHHAQKAVPSIETDEWMANEFCASTLLQMGLVALCFQNVRPSMCIYVRPFVYACA